MAILTLGHEVPPRAMKLFAGRYPGVPVSIRTLHSPQMVSAPVLQEADAGFLQRYGVAPGWGPS